MSESLGSAHHQGRGSRTKSLSRKSVNAISAYALSCQTERRRQVGEGEPLEALENGSNLQRGRMG